MSSKLFGKGYDEINAALSEALSATQSIPAPKSHAATDESMPTWTRTRHTGPPALPRAVLTRWDDDPLPATCDVGGEDVPAFFMPLGSLIADTPTATGTFWNGETGANFLPFVWFEWATRHFDQDFTDGLETLVIPWLARHTPAAIDNAPTRSKVATAKEKISSLIAEFGRVQKWADHGKNWKV